VALAGTEISVPAGIVTPLENVNGCIARRIMETEKMQGANQHIVLGILGKEYNELEEKPSNR
jgi:hypothetical protein